MFVSDQTPVVMVEAGSRASLTPGAHVIVYAQRDTTGDLAAQRISVGATDRCRRSDGWITTFNARTTSIISVVADPI